MFTKDPGETGRGGGARGGLLQHLGETMEPALARRRGVVKNSGTLGLFHRCSRRICY